MNKNALSEETLTFIFCLLLQQPDEKDICNLLFLISIYGRPLIAHIKRQKHSCSEKLHLNISLVCKNCFVQIKLMHCP